MAPLLASNVRVSDPCLCVGDVGVWLRLDVPECMDTNDSFSFQSTCVRACMIVRPEVLLRLLGDA